jgi:hypothetical protein
MLRSLHARAATPARLMRALAWEEARCAALLRDFDADALIDPPAIQALLEGPGSESPLRDVLRRLREVRPGGTAPRGGFPAAPQVSADRGATHAAVASFDRAGAGVTVAPLSDATVGAIRSAVGVHKQAVASVSRPAPSARRRSSAFCAALSEEGGFEQSTASGNSDPRATDGPRATAKKIGSRPAALTTLLARQPVHTGDRETGRLVEAILADQEISAERLTGIFVTRSDHAGAIGLAGLSAERSGDPGAVPPPLSLDIRIERILERIAERRRADHRKATERNEIDSVRPADAMAAPPPAPRDPAPGAALPDTTPLAGHRSGLARLAARFTGTGLSSLPEQAAHTGAAGRAPWSPISASRASEDDAPLAERLADILRREARRQGIDLSGSGP